MDDRRPTTRIACAVRVVLAATVIAGALFGCTLYLPRDETPEARFALEGDAAICRRVAAEGQEFGREWPLGGMLAGAFVGAIEGAQAGAWSGLSTDQIGIGAAAGAAVGLVIGFATSTADYVKAANRCMDQRGYRRAS